MIRVKGFRHTTIAALALGLTAVTLAAQGAPPALVIGTFTDDYATTHVLISSEWRHGRSAVYEITEWHPDARFFIARNGAANPSDPGKWSRVDWIPLRMKEGDRDFSWAYCMSAYDAPTSAAARAVTIAKPESPKTGCNGFPFTRMARLKE